MPKQDLANSCKENIKFIYCISEARGKSKGSVDQMCPTLLITQLGISWNGVVIGCNLVVICYGHIFGRDSFQNSE